MKKLAQIVDGKVYLIFNPQELYGTEDLTDMFSNEIIFLDITDNDTVEVDMVYDEASNSFTSAHKEEPLPTRSYKRDDYGLFISAKSFDIFNHGSSIWDRPDVVGVNLEINQNGEIISNNPNQSCPESPIIFDDVLIMNKDFTLKRKVTIPNIHHECILGTNKPRYFTPAFDYAIANNNVLAITIRAVQNDLISPHELLDDVIVEYDDRGNLIWEWVASDHFDELEFTQEEKAKIKDDPNLAGSNIYNKTGGDWLHCNSACALSPNKWHDAGDMRFKPENIIVSSRETSRIFIIDKASKSIVWLIKGTHLMPLFQYQHYAHMIPKGLIGEGNILFYDNGDQERGYSKVVELDPTTTEIVWEYESEEIYSKFMGCVQRLEDGNTLITVSQDGRIVEISQEKTVVINKKLKDSVIYRATRFPLKWLEQHEPTQKEKILTALAQQKEENLIIMSAQADAYEAEQVNSLTIMLALADIYEKGGAA